MVCALDSFIQILQQELELYDRLNVLLKDEQQALKSMKSDWLMEVANAKECVALQLKALDESRRLALDSVAKEFDLGDSDEVCLEDVAQAAPAAEAEELRRLGDRLRKAIESGRGMNDKNRFLADYSLKIVRESMQSLANPKSNKRTYRADGGLRAYSQGAQVLARSV